jgi:UDP-N-acetylmuramate dehydrogenase
VQLEQARPLAPLTTLRLGGVAAHFVAAQDRGALQEALAWAQQAQQPVCVLGGGSNLVVADQGVPGLVLQVATRGVSLAIEGKFGLLTVQAGEPWDAVVELAVSEGLAGIECLTGIPGSSGATPIQNVGAYGQEVAQVIDAVEVLERASGAIEWLPADACGFAYRDSRFKREPERYLVLAVRLRLRRDGVPSLRYPELAEAVAENASLREVRAAVRALRASKGMLIDDGFVPSAGSFFTNPIVTREQADALAMDMPRFPLDDGRVKLSAGWLIEHAGVSKGLRKGAVGVSARHALALVHHGGGTTAELLALAGEVQRRVRDIFDVQLEIEPVRW